MGTYMTVVLQKDYHGEAAINKINNDLFLYFGANHGVHFGTRQQLQQETDYLNQHPDGLKQLPGWKRPISAMELEQAAHWLRIGEFSFKISAVETTDEARDAVAVCKWIMATKGKYIVPRRSSNYQQRIIQQYLHPLFIDEGFDLKLLWEPPLLTKPDVLAGGLSTMDPLRPAAPTARHLFLKSAKKDAKKRLSAKSQQWQCSQHGRTVSASCLRRDTGWPGTIGTSTVVAVPLATSKGRTNVRA
jgi:hypothetical protein